MIHKCISYWNKLKLNWVLALLTDKLERLLEVLFDVLMGRIAGGNLFVLETGSMVERSGWLAGDVQDAVGADIGGIDGVASVTQQQVRKDGRGGVGFDI